MLQAVADLLKNHGGYSWVGLYDVDHSAGVVANVAWSGPSAPEYPTFPIAGGLTGAAVSQRMTVNVGDVTTDALYLRAFGTTRSEIIIPVFDQQGKVVGTIDVESEKANAFSPEEQAFWEASSNAIRSLWEQSLLT